MYTRNAGREWTAKAHSSGDVAMRMGRASAALPKGRSSSSTAMSSTAPPQAGAAASLAAPAVATRDTRRAPSLRGASPAAAAAATAHSSRVGEFSLRRAHAADVTTVRSDTSAPEQCRYTLSSSAHLCSTTICDIQLRNYNISKANK